MAKPENIVQSIKIEIEAPASLVWEVLVDLPRYGEWNSFCPAARSTLKIGDPIVMDVILPGMTTPGTVSETIIAVEPEQLLAWEQRATAENKDAARREQWVVSLGPERCTYQTLDAFVGLNADTLMKNYGALVKQGFDSVAVDLKKRAESLYAARKRA